MKKLIILIITSFLPIVSFANTDDPVTRYCETLFNKQFSGVLLGYDSNNNHFVANFTITTGNQLSYCDPWGQGYETCNLNATITLTGAPGGPFKAATNSFECGNLSQIAPQIMTYELTMATDDDDGRFLGFHQWSFDWSIKLY